MLETILENLGYTNALANHRKEGQLDVFDVGRVIAEHKDRYTVQSEAGEFDAELIGNLRFSAESKLDFPAVGDWVALSEYDDGKALIHAVFPRRSILERQAVGTSGQKQIIATNVDVGLIVQSVNRDFSINRLERYLAICHASNVSPLIILSKIDLLPESEVKSLLNQIHERIKDVPVIAVSNASLQGIDQLKALLENGKTYCLLGSSGVGKSTLLNQLTGRELMDTAAISERIDRGKHITSHRELVILESGGVLIDNPGMRELGMTDASAGIEKTFDAILERTEECKFKDCTHTNETGCAVLEALAKGELDPDLLANYQKMERERAHFESSVEEKKNKDKQFGKMIKNVKKIRKKNKF